MDTDSIFLTTFDIASQSNSGVPISAVSHGQDAKPQGTRACCPVCGNPLRTCGDKEGQRRHLNALLSQAYFEAVVTSVPDADNKLGSTKVEVPWGRPGTGFTRLFEALVMALIRQIPVKRAARILRTSDARLWRFVDREVGKEIPGRPVGFPLIERRSGGKGREQLRLFELDLSRGVPRKEPVTARTIAEELKACRESAANLGAIAFGLSKVLVLAAIDALLRAAQTFGHFRVIKDKNDALGKARAEEALLSPGKSRAPPGGGLP